VSSERDELEALGEPPVSPEERQRAASLARLVDNALAGSLPPPALEAEERLLLETATALHASMSETELPLARQNAVLDEVFRGRRRAPTSSNRASTQRPVAAPRRFTRALPWALTALSAAAALVLWLGRPAPPPAPAPQPLATLRSTDAIVGGPIPAEQAANASARLDAIVAERRAARARVTP
jgi:hypothetical protein